MGGAVRAGWPYTIGEHGSELFVPGADGYVMAHGAASLAAAGASAGAPSGGAYEDCTILLELNLDGEKLGRAQWRYLKGLGIVGTDLGFG
jgi:hypothetical protein